MAHTDRDSSPAPPRTPDETGFSVDGSAERVRDRLVSELVQMHSVWFPSAREVEVWRETEIPLYVCWRDDRTFEIGPRVLSINAARLCPVLRGEIVEDGGGRSRLDWRLGFPTATEWLLRAWGAVLMVWAGSLVLLWRAGDEETFGLFVWWAVLAVFWLLAHGVGRLIGGQQLRAHLPWLQEVLDG